MDICPSICSSSSSLAAAVCSITGAFSNSAIGFSLRMPARICLILFASSFCISMVLKSFGCAGSFVVSFGSSAACSISSLCSVTAAAISFSVFIMMLSAITSVSDLGISFIISSSRVGTAASIAASLVSISTILLGLS